MKILTAHRIATGGEYEYPDLNRLEFRSKKFVDLDDLILLLEQKNNDYKKEGHILGCVEYQSLIYELNELSKDVNHSETMCEGKYKVCGECYHTRYKE